MSEQEELMELAAQYARDANAAYAKASLAYVDAGARIRNAAIILAVATALALAGMFSLVAAGHRVDRAPTLHTRRITVGDQTVRLEIPDGQCASALGVTICVPDHPPRKVSP